MVYNNVNNTDKEGEIMRIKELRESLKLTQEDLAKKLHIGRTTVSMWENGEAMPRADKLPEIAKVLNCSIEDLYDHEREVS